MWIFSSKSSDSTPTSLGSVRGSGGTGDPLGSYTLLQPSTEEALPGPFGLRWSHQSATSHRVPGDRVTVFCLNLPASTSVSDISATSNVICQTVKRLKTLRHPNILNWLSGSEQPKTPFYIITEEVCSLKEYLREKADSSSNFNFLASWGIYQVTRALGFLNDDCKLSHNFVCAAAVYVNRSGEWKVGRPDYVTPLNDAMDIKLSIYQPAAYSVPKGHCIDARGLACLIWEIFNPEPLTEAIQLFSKASLDRLPRPLVAPYRRLLATQASMVSSHTRSPFNAFRKIGFFRNDYIDTLLFLEEIQLKEKDEKTQFLAGLGQRAVGLFPDDICRYKILPHLVNSLQFGSAGVEALVPVLELSHLLPSTDFEVVVVPGLVRLFASTDRATRVRLLDHLPRFVSKLPRSLVESKIFGPVAAGFSDANPLVREATVRAMVHLAPALPSSILNDVLLRHLTHLQFKDQQGGIRTNATICLAKLAGRLDPGVRRGPLLNALLRATRDPFPPSRQAAVTGLAACQAFFSAQELAGKVIPCLSFVAVDAEKDIRDTALKALKGMVERLEKASEDTSVGEADTSVVGELASTARAAAVAAAGVKLTAAGASIGNWALTALSSLSSRLISSSQQAPQTTLGPPVSTASSGAIQETPGSKPESELVAVAATIGKPNRVTEWEEEEEEEEMADSENKETKKLADFGWDDLNNEDEDGTGGWNDEEDNNLDFSSLRVVPKTASSTSVPKHSRNDDLLIDWSEPLQSLETPRVTGASLNSSKVSQKSVPVESDWQWGEEKIDWNVSQADPVMLAPRLQSAKASSLGPPSTASTWSSSLRTSKPSTEGTSGLWQRAKPSLTGDDFFEELLGPKSTSICGSSKASSVASPGLRQSKKSAVEAKQIDDEGEWSAW